jgi:hypothetical protein
MSHRSHNKRQGHLWLKKMLFCFYTPGGSHIPLGWWNLCGVVLSACLARRCLENHPLWSLSPPGQKKLLVQPHFHVSCFLWGDDVVWLMNFQWPINRPSWRYFYHCWWLLKVLRSFSQKRPSWRPMGFIYLGWWRVLIFDFSCLISIQDQVCPLFDSLHMSLVFLVRPQLLISL